MNTIDSVKIRMYRHGFGDCFLLRFYTGDTRQCSMLIDCGLKRNDSVEGVTLEDVRDDIVKMLKEGAGDKNKPAVDILVVTHEHWDHVSGFHPKRKLFDSFSFNQVWMAWTENPDDDDAKILNKGLVKRIAALKVASKHLKLQSDGSPAFYMNVAGGDRLLSARKDFSAALESVMDFVGPLGITKTPGGISVRDNYKISIDTQLAMDHIRTLAKGKNAGMRYFNPGDLVEDLPLLPGIRIYVLGPPKNKLLNKAAPSGGANKEVYFGDSSLAGFVDGVLAMEMGGEGGSDDGRPFGKVPVLDKQQAKSKKYYTLKEGYFDKNYAWRTIDNDWLDMASGLAMQMDTDTNNTSLVLAIEFIQSGEVMLFPGDAQVGNWLSWHEQEWTIKKGNGTVKVNAEHLLNNTIFYKVGHHSSHNATLKEKGLEMMTHPKLVAFVPEKEKQYKGIPYAPLIGELKKKTRGRLIVSADVNFPANAAITRKPDALDAKEWKTFKDAIELQKVFVEYTIKL